MSRNDYQHFRRKLLYLISTVNTSKVQTPFFFTEITKAVYENACYHTLLVVVRVYNLCNVWFTANQRKHHGYLVAQQ